MSQKPLILCVDDEQNVLDVLGRMFDRMAIVMTARSGAEALQALRTRPVDLLITDQKMPEMTGIELVRAAREHGIAVTTILLTAYTNPSDLIAAINDGQVFRYVTKPWDVNDLMMTVRNALSVAALHKEKERLLESLHKRIEALNVMYEVSRQSAKDAPSLDAIVDRLLATVGRVLPHDASAVLVESSDGAHVALRIRANAPLSEGALLHVKDSVLSSHRKGAGVVLPEERVVTSVTGEVGGEADVVSTFPCAISVPLVAERRTVGTLALFSTRPDSYSTEDGELLDLLVNQTTDAIAHVRAAERESRLRVEQMVEAMGDGVILTDAKGAVVVVNRAARELLELSAVEGRPPLEQVTSALGLSPFELVRGWEYGGTKTVREALELGGRSLELVVTPVAGTARELKGLVVVLRDVSAQKMLTQRKDEFVGIISHELRTPLTSIAGAVDLVLNGLAGDVSEKQRRFLSMARESTERLNALVDDLLDLAKFEQGALHLDFQLLRLDELVHAAAERYAPLCAEKKIELTVEVQGGLKLLADPNRLVQVVNNLLTNALKFTPSGGAVKLTAGRSSDAAGYTVLSVWNSGDAIADADLERIFDRFEQARSAKTKNLPGTGLGLSICKTIVDGHGGRIWAEPGPGARFVAVFPETPPEHAPAAEAQRKSSRGTVLVVDDARELAWVLKAQLLAAGFKVLVANTADDALTLARRARPDVITLDHQLPDIAGLELLDIFRNDPETRSARVVMLSGRDVRELAVRAGAAAFLQKPINPANFLSSVEAALREHGGGRGRVLVVDDDAQITAICAEVLANQGFEVEHAHSVEAARAAISRRRPDLMLLDVALPDGDGFQFFEALKTERAPSPLSVIFISARSDTPAKVRALKLGGDDYLTKPFDALELGARVESVLRRRTFDTSTSPTTQLPGSAAIEREVQRRIGARAPFAFCYLDLDNLKAFNDFYGFAKADGVVKQTADILREVVAQLGDGSEFVGHVAGDDFVFIVRPEQAELLSRRIIESFDRIIPLYYERADRERGSIEAEDRYGQRRAFPIMSVSIAAVMTDGAMDHPELARQAAELKKRAKAVQGSVVLFSDRPDGERSIA